MKQKTKNYLITAIVATAICFIILIAYNIFALKGAKLIMKVLCDAFFLTGFMFVGTGALVFCASKGAFDAISYLFHSLFVTHNWSKTKFKDRQTYGDYVEEKRSKNKPLPVHIFVVGLVFVAISVIFLIVYNNV